MADSTAELIAARATTTATAHAFDLLVLLQLRTGNATDACAAKVGLLGLDAAETAEL